MWVSRLVWRVCLKERDFFGGGERMSASACKGRDCLFAYVQFALEPSSAMDILEAIRIAKQGASGK